MTDPNLFALGCVVSFIALAGFYVYVRTRFTEAEMEREPVKSTVVHVTHEHDAA